MNRFRLLLENFLIYGLSGIIGKVIPFLMLPVITRLVPGSYYIGLNDMSNILVSFAQALAIMGMYDAMFRLFFEQNEEEFKQTVCSSALGFTVTSSAFIFVVLFLNKEAVAEFFFGDRELTGLVVVTSFSILAGATNNIIAAPTRMQNKRRVYLFTNLIPPLVSYTAAIFLLLAEEYIYALPIGTALSALIIELIFIALNHRWFSFRKIRWGCVKRLLSIGIPLMPSFLVYWIFNSCDRLMISKMLGMEQTGIYAVGSKFGHISQLLYTAFTGGWQYFAYSTMKDEDQVNLTSRIFEYLCCLSMGAGIIISFCPETVFIRFFGLLYKEAYCTVPYLFAAPLVQMLYQVAGNQFLVIKKTWPFSLILFCGAIGNLILNAFLIPEIGIEGAAIATLTGFGLSVLIGIIVLQKMELFCLYKRCKVVMVLFIFYLILWRSNAKENPFFPVLVGILVIAVYIRLYQRELTELYSNFKPKNGN